MGLCGLTVPIHPVPESSKEYEINAFFFFFRTDICRSGWVLPTCSAGSPNRLYESTHVCEVKELVPCAEGVFLRDDR